MVLSEAENVGGIAMNSFSARNAFADIRNFLAGRFVGATRDEFFLEEVVKLIFCKYELMEGRENTFDEIALSGLYRKAFQKVLEKHKDIFSDRFAEIELDPVSIKYIDEKLSELDILNLDRDIIGDAYEIFVGESIKGQSGQFFTPQNAAEALVKMVAPAKGSKVLDLTCGAGGFLVAVAKYWGQKGSGHYHDLLYGIDKDEYLTKLCKIHLACLGQDTCNIICADSLLWDEKVLGKGIGQFDAILTNPPFGVNIQAGTIETLSKYQLAYKRKKDKKGNDIRSNVINESVPPQVVFMEQCINLTKIGGYIGIVVPESMISNKKYSYAVRHIMDRCVVKAVIGMPDDLFKTSGKSGTHTKTCLLVLHKGVPFPQKEYEIFMAEAKWCGHDSRGREIPNDDIPTIVNNYLLYQKSGEVPNNNLGFIISSNNIRDEVLAPRAYNGLNIKAACAEETYSLITMGQLIEEKVISISTGHELGKLAYGTGRIPFIRTSDISNWGIKSDPKHLVSEELYEQLSEKQDVREGDILMVKDGSYLIGTCAMITQYDTKIIYQSHLYKIRVADNNAYGLTKYYLLAALSSDFVRKQIAANTFSHDIINSLGDRLKELVIPIRKDKQKRQDISEMVKESIIESANARELAKRAKMEVVGT